MQFILKYRLTLLLLLFFSFLTYKSSSGQSLPKVDSLRSELNKPIHDTTKIKILFELGDLFVDGPSDSLLFYYQYALSIAQNYESQPYKALNKKNKKTAITFKKLSIKALIEIGIEYFFRSDYSKALEYYFKALDIAEKTNDKSLISQCYNEIGIVYKNQGKYKLALDYYEKALLMATELNDKPWIAACNTNIGNIYRKKGNYEKALEYYLSALKTFEQLQQKRRVAICYINIGNIYEEQHDYEKALEYYKRALNISIETGDKLRISDSYINIGKIYSNREDFSNARTYFNKSLDIYKEFGYKHEMDNCYKYIGYTYKIQNDFQKAIEFYNKALEISEEEEDKSSIAETMINLGNLFINKNEYNRALDYSNRGLQLAVEIGNMLTIKNAYFSLVEIWERLNNTGKALEYYKLYSNLKDSLYNVEKYKAITEMEVKYESEKKEQQLALLTEKNEVQMLKLNQRNRLMFAFVIFFILAILIIYLFFRHNRLKVKHKTIELEQQLLRSQMNPHFIFNSLIAIQSYIYKKDIIHAGDYLAKFANLIRLILENSRVEFIPFEKEINTLELYLELQSLRFENKFVYKIEIDKNIDTGNISVPPMLTQPFIENAVEHGMRHKKEDGLIHIKFNKKDDLILFKVEDNGLGRIKASELKKQKKHKSLAIAITNERLTILSKRLKQKFNIEIIDINDNTGIPCGTEVIFTMPGKIIT